jgi:hypothetical protein
MARRKPKMHPEAIKLLTGKETFAGGPILMTDLTRRESLDGMSKQRVGSYDSKQGSMRRSAKGRTRMLPNGYTKFEVAWWEVHVGAYPAPKVVK